MANITTVTLTAGVPTAGTGTVSTLDNLIGTTGAPSAQIQTVQGNASGVAIPVSLASLPSGAVTNAGTFAVQVTSAPSTAVTNAGTFAVQSDSSVSQASTTSGQKGVLVQGAVTTAAPSYTTAQTSPLSLDTAGNLRVNVVAGGAGGGVVTQSTAANLNATVKITDGTTALPILAASSGAPGPTTPAVPVSIRDQLPAGLAAPGSSAPVVIAPQTLDVSVTPTVTAGAYTANNVLGGIMTFAAILPSVGNNGVLQSITAKFKATAVTGNINVCIFKASPSNGTYTDHAAATYNSLDMANLIGIYQLTTPLTLGAATMTVYCLDAIGKAFVGASTSLFAVVTVGGTPTPASTSDFTLELSVLPG